MPSCDANGLYASIQSNQNLSILWCADKVTGEYINGTTKHSWEGKPTCPGKDKLLSQLVIILS